MANINYKDTPHIGPGGPMDTFAFNALCVAGIIAGIHAGLSRILVYREDAYLLDTDAAKALKAQGWTFILVDVPKPA